MRIGTRIFVSLVVPIVLAMGLLGYLDEQRGRGILQEELSRDGRAVARSVQVAVEYAMRDAQLEDVRRLVDAMSGYERVLGVRIFDASGARLYESRSLRDVPDDPASVRAILGDGKPVERRGRVAGEPVVTFSLPLRGARGERDGAVQVVRSESFVDEDARASRSFIVRLTAVMIAATGAVLFVVTHWSVTRPVRGLVRSFREAGAGDLESRAPEDAGDEFGRLAYEFNAMCARLAAARASLVAEQEERRAVEARLRQAEHLASLGRLTAGLAHEIGTPLGVIAGRADSLRRRLGGGGAIDGALRTVTEQIDRIAKIVRGMLDFARAREPSLTPTDLAAVIRTVVELVEDRFAGAGCRIVLAIPASLPRIPADEDQLRQVFLNLVLNALDAMSGGGRLRVTAEALGTAPRESGIPELPCIAIALEDTGTGIPVHHIERVFEPFFTTKAVGRGTGLGLSIAYGIVREHGGEIRIESPSGAGTRVTVFLPILRALPALHAVS